MIFTIDILEESKITIYSKINCKMSNGKTLTIADVMTKSDMATMYYYYY